MGSSDPRTPRCCAPGSPCSGAPGASLGVDTRAQYLGLSGLAEVGVGWAPGHAESAAAGVGRVLVPHRALPFVWKLLSRLEPLWLWVGRRPPG